MQPQPELLDRDAPASSSAALAPYIQQHSIAASAKAAIPLRLKPARVVDGCDQNALRRWPEWWRAAMSNVTRYSSAVKGKMRTAPPGALVMGSADGGKELYLAIDGVKIARRGVPGTPQAGHGSRSNPATPFSTVRARRSSSSITNQERNRRPAMSLRYLIVVSDVAPSTDCIRCWHRIMSEPALRHRDFWRVERFISEGRRGHPGAKISSPSRSQGCLSNSVGC
jgi:hypothetical protein